MYPEMTSGACLIWIACWIMSWCVCWLSCVKDIVDKNESCVIIMGVQDSDVTRQILPHAANSSTVTQQYSGVFTSNRSQFDNHDYNYDWYNIYN